MIHYISAAGASTNNRDISRSYQKPLCIDIEHNNEHYTIKMTYEWLLFSDRTKQNLIDYFKLCIDTNELTGKLTVKT